MPRLDLVADIGEELQRLADPIDAGGDERRVLDRDLQLLDRRDQVNAVRVLAQHRREQPHQRLTADWGPFVEPDAVLADDNIDLAAVGRVP